MNMHTRIDLPNGVRHWINDGSTAPDWLRKHIAGEKAANGSFLIATPVGAARVHSGHVVIDYQGSAWCRAPEEVAELITGICAEASAAGPAIGPGKSARFGSTSKLAKKSAFREVVGAPPSIEFIRPIDLNVDPTYQRSIENEGSRRLIASIAANFDWRLFSPLLISRRPDGSKIIIDGQHRWAGVIRRGDITHLPCCLYSYESAEEEAKVFIMANRARKSMNRLDDFYAALAAADEDALEIQRLVTDAGLVVSRSMSVAARKPGEITFTSSISSALRRHGEEVVSAALTSMAEAFDGGVMAQGSSVFNALVLVFAEPPEGFDPDALVPALRGFDSDGFRNVIRDVQGSDERSTALRNAIVVALRDCSPLSEAA
jgi:hypothetical protein